MCTHAATHTELPSSELRALSVVNRTHELPSCACFCACVYKGHLI